MASLFTFRQLIATKSNVPQKRRSLDELERFVDFEAFRPQLDSIANYNTTAGHPHYDVVMMFKILVLQTFYNLSDDEMEFQLNDRASFMRFCKIEACDKVPDSRTIWLFRERLGMEGSKQLFDRFHQLMVDAGLRYSGGTIVDASFVEAPRQRNTREENVQIKETGKPNEQWNQAKTIQKDCDARWTKKDNVNHYGYKHHTACDMETKIITDFAVTPANVNDVNGFEDLIGPETCIVLGDAAYESQAISKRLAKRGIRLYHNQRRSWKKPELSDAQKEFNRMLSSKRCRIEHVFGDIKHIGGDMVRCIGKRRANIRVALVSIVYNMRRYCYLSRIGELCPNI